MDSMGCQDPDPEHHHRAQELGPPRLLRPALPRGA
jgi:hypothetical protein